MDGLFRPLGALSLEVTSRVAWYPIFYDLKPSFEIILYGRSSSWTCLRGMRYRWDLDWSLIIYNLDVFFRVRVISNGDRGGVGVDRGEYAVYFDSWIEGYILLAFILSSIFADRVDWSLMDRDFDYSLALKYIKDFGCFKDYEQLKMNKLYQ